MTQRPLSTLMVLLMLGLPVTAQAELPANPAPIAAANAAGDATGEGAPAMLAGWMIGKMIWTTGDPSPLPSQDRPLSDMPEGWAELARIEDLVIANSGMINGYVADVGGFLGIGVHRIMLGFGQIHLVEVAGQSHFVTNLTRADLKALPALDTSVLRQ